MTIRMFSIVSSRVFLKCHHRDHVQSVIYWIHQARQSKHIYVIPFSAGTDFRRQNLTRL